MSGGSLNYLCYKGPDELFNYIEEMEAVELVLLGHGAQDIARDVRRLIEYVKSAEIRIAVLAENLRGVFKAVEWYSSGDYGKDSLLDQLEKYRTKEESHAP